MHATCDPIAVPGGPSIGIVRRLGWFISLLLGLGLTTSVLVAWMGATMHRGGWPDVPLTSTPLNEPSVRLGLINQWKILEWHDASVTRRIGWGWREEYREDPCSALSRRDPLHAMDDSGRFPRVHLPAFSLANQLPPEAAPPAGVLVDALPTFAEIEAGWPVRCFRASWAVGDHRLDPPGSRLRGGVLVGPWHWPWRSDSLGIWMQSTAFDEEHVLPLTPMVAGLLANTAAWSGLWLLAFVAVLVPMRVVQLRRWKRRERAGRCGRCRYDLANPDGNATSCPECGWTTGQRPPLRPHRVMFTAMLVLIALALANAAFAAVRLASAEHLPPLHRAAAAGDADAVRALLAAGAPADRPAPPMSSTNTSALQSARAIDWAAAHGHAEVVRALLDAGADPNMVGTLIGPLALAAAHEHAGIVGMLLSAGADPLERPSATLAPVAIAAMHDDSPLLERMLDVVAARGAGPAPLELFVTALPNRSSAVQRLVLERATTTPQVDADLAIFAFRMEDFDLVDAMIARGFDPAAHSSELVAYIVHHPDFSSGDASVFERIEFLATRGADLTASYGAGTTALHDVATIPGAGDALRLLIALGLPVDATDSRQETALHVAAEHGLPGSIRALIDANADATIRNTAGLTPRNLWQRWFKDHPEHHQIRGLLEAAEANAP